MHEVTKIAVSLKHGISAVRFRRIEHLRAKKRFCLNLIDCGSTGGDDKQAANSKSKKIVFFEIITKKHQLLMDLKYRTSRKHRNMKLKFLTENLTRQRKTRPRRRPCWRTRWQ
jgi:hypothetical protein